MSCLWKPFGCLLLYNDIIPEILSISKFTEKFILWSIEHERALCILFLLVIEAVSRYKHITF